MNPDALFDDIAAELAPRGATVGAMFGKRALKAGGKVFACLRGNALAFRLNDSTPDHQAALALGGAELFDPSCKKRPFKDWVAVPVTQASHWPRFAEIALNRLTP